MTREISVEAVLRRIELKIRSIEDEIQLGLSSSASPMQRRANIFRQRLTRGRAKTAIAA